MKSGKTAWTQGVWRGKFWGRLLAGSALAGLIATCDGGGDLVDPPVPTSITVTPSAVMLNALGDTAVLAARVLDQNGGVVTDVTLSWSSGDQSVATVSGGGVVTAVGNGSAVVTARAGGATGQAQVVVEQRIASVVVTPDSVMFDAVGDTASLAADALDANGALVEGAAVSWGSGDESVATVSVAGLVMTAGNGTVAVSASADGVAGEAQVVVQQRVASVVVGPDSLTFDALGDTALLAAEALDPNGVLVEGAAVSWASGDQSVATISVAGVVTAAGNGTAAVTASAEDATGEARVLVEQRVASVIVGPDSLMLDALGDSASLAAEALDPNGVLVAGAAVSWASSDESVATVSVAGVVTAVGNGTAAITASAGDAAGETRVVVEQRVASVIVEPDSLMLDALGNSASLAAEARDANGAAVSGVAMSWRSGDESVATVSGAGVVAAVGDGTTVVTASGGGAADQAQIVVEQRVASLVVTPALLELRALGDTARLAARARDSNGTVVNGAAVSWSSGNEAVATVSRTGLVTAVGPGKTAVTARVEGQRGQADVVVDTVPHPDEAGLVALYNATNGAYWNNNSNWLTDAPISAWHGVGVDASQRVSSLNLSSNGLSGSLPNALGTLSFLRRLNLINNSLTGAMPDGMTSLAHIDEISVDAEVCAPQTPAFEQWISGISNHNLAYCYTPPPVDEPVAYVMQAVPATNYPVPILAGETGLLRVFVTAHNPDSVGMPPVRATFYSGGAVVHTAEIPAQPNTPIPDSVAEGHLSRSANAEIPGSVLTAGVEMVVEIDPGGTLGSSVSVAGRIPKTGRTSLDVQTVDAFQLTVIPFLLESDPDSTLLTLTDSLGPDHELFGLTRTLLPIIDMEVTVHDPVWTTSSSTRYLVDLVQATRVAEGCTGYWMGMMGGTTGGAAVRGGRDSFSEPVAWIVAHELGHNLSLRHAPCGGAGNADPAYPYSNGASGVWGWAPGTVSLVFPSTPDIMGYCNGGWISDYHFSKTFSHRTKTIPPPNSAVLSADEQSLLLWGGAGADGSVYLNPAFVVDAPPSLPDAGGEYRLVGEAEDGSVLFSHAFAVDEVADGDGGSGFAFALPVEPSWAGTLARITLTGGGSSAVLGREGDEAAVLLRDPSTGQVRGLLLDVPTDPEAQADWMTTLRAARMDVQVSRGIPAGAEVWQR